jgi:hypothetical protein
MARSFFAAIAAIWFVWNAWTFAPPDDADAYLAVMTAARMLFGGLVFVALALVDWTALGRSISRFFDSD